MVTPHDRLGRSSSRGNTATDTHRMAPSSSAAAPAACANHTSSHTLEMDQLVGGVLSAQAVSGALETLTQRVRGFDEKMVNLTRLVQLGQRLQDDKVATLSAENAELRGLVQRQASTLSQLQRDVVTLTQGVVPELQGRVRQVDETQRAWQARSEGERAHWERSVRRSVGQLQGEVDKLTTELTGVRATCTSLSGQLAATDCKAEAEYRKLRVLLRRKMTEAGALSTLVQKELMQVSQMAQQHDKLRLGAVYDRGGGHAATPRTLEELKFARRSKS